MLRVARCFLLLGLSVAVSPVLAEEFIPRRQEKLPGPPLSPEEAIRKMTVPAGFTVELVAAEPDIVNPVAMTFDERGRVWITESVEYPRTSPGVGRDRVKVLEDTNGDGKADKVTVFAEGLNIPCGIAVGHGGVWISNAPDLLFLQDTDGDGKADRREVVVTGFGRTDTHELPNSFVWGPDGWLYGLNGVFNYSHVHYSKENPNYDAKHPGWQFTCAMFRVHPRTREFELFAEGTSNPWGIAWDTQGSAFLSACVIDHLWHLTQTGYYHRQGGPYPPFTWKIASIVRHQHQMAAYCGIHYFDSDAYPEQYRNRLYMGNIHGNCINVDTLQRDGSTYFATGEPDFLTANDVWFMTVSQKTGPDGCLYVLDWYDRYHCYQDANRDPEGIDRLKGRLYRVRYKDTPRVAGFDLSKESDERLIERLGQPNDYIRHTAQRILQERNKPELVERLAALATAPGTPQIQRNHAVFALMGCDLVQHGGEWDIPKTLFASDDPFLRAWALRCLELHALRSLKKQPIENVEMQLAEYVIAGLEDESPDVRLQAAILAGQHARAMQPYPSYSEALAAGLIASPDDKLLPKIIWRNLLANMERHPHEAAGFARVTGVGRSSSGQEIVGRIVEWLLARDPFDALPVAKILAAQLDPQGGSEAAAGRCLAMISTRVQNREIGGERLDALRLAIDPAIKDVLKRGAKSPLYLNAALLATTWRDPAGLAAVRTVLATPNAPADQRLQALEALIAANDASLLEPVRQILADRESARVEFRGRVLASLGRLDDPRVAEAVLARFGKLDAELQPRAIELLTQRVSWAKQLLAAIGRDEVPANVLNQNQVRRLISTGDKELIEQVGARWGVIRDTRNPEREHVIAEMKQHIRQKPGDAFAGEKVFGKVCGQCHKMYGQGEEVGPDITVNGRSSFDQLLSNVFDPSLVIGAAYRAYTVVTADGRVLTGLLTEDGEQRVVLKVQGGKLETIARGDVELIQASEVSMMPEQLERQITPEELSDLFAFLTLDRHPRDSEARQLPGVRPVEPRQTNNPQEFGSLLAEVAPGFTATAVGEGGLALLTEHGGRSTVVQTHPLDRNKPCVLKGKFNLPADRKSKLVLSVGHHPQGDWQLAVKANGRPLLETSIEEKTTSAGWADLTIDLSQFAGQTVDLELHNQASGWNYEYAYWGRAAVVSE